MSAWKRFSRIVPLMRILLTLGLLLSATAAQAIERVTYYHNDALGSPVAATDGNGTLLWRESYAPYGERLTHEAGSKDTVWYTGKPEEAAFGLNYFGARWYDSKIGRFMGVDPAGFSADNIQSFNRYAYANNNPYLYVDPDGNSPLEWVFVTADLASLGTNLAGGNYGGATWDAVNLFLDLQPIPGAREASLVAKEALGAEKLAVRAREVANTSGRAGKQERLRELASDDKLGSADRGWIQQEMNSIERGQRKNIRNPPGKDLAHERGREAAKGYGYEYSNLQDRDLHRLQHKYDNFGKKNTERSPQ